MVFLFSLYCQQQQGLSPLGTGLAFLPMTLLIALTSLVAGRAAAKVGPGLPAERAGTASGVLNTSRQVGGALAIAVFGALLAHQGFLDGLRASLLIAGLLLAATTLASLTLRPTTKR